MEVCFCSEATRESAQTFHFRPHARSRLFFVEFYLFIYVSLFKLLSGVYECAHLLCLHFPECSVASDNPLVETCKRINGPCYDDFLLDQIVKIRRDNLTVQDYYS